MFLLKGKPMSDGRLFDEFVRARRVSRWAEGKGRATGGSEGNIERAPSQFEDGAGIGSLVKRKRVDLEGDIPDDAEEEMSALKPITPPRMDWFKSPGVKKSFLGEPEIVQTVYRYGKDGPPSLKRKQLPWKLGEPVKRVYFDHKLESDDTETGYVKAPAGGLPMGIKGDGRSINGFPPAPSERDHGTIFMPPEQRLDPKWREKAEPIYPGAVIQPGGEGPKKPNYVQPWAGPPEMAKAPERSTVLPWTIYGTLDQKGLNVGQLYHTPSHQFYRWDGTYFHPERSPFGKAAPSLTPLQIQDYWGRRGAVKAEPDRNILDEIGKAGARGLDAALMDPIRQGVSIGTTYPSAYLMDLAGLPDQAAGLRNWRENVREGSESELWSGRTMHKRSDVLKPHNSLQVGISDGYSDPLWWATHIANAAPQVATQVALGGMGPIGFALASAVPTISNTYKETYEEMIRSGHRPEDATKGALAEGLAAGAVDYLTSKIEFGFLTGPAKQEAKDAAKRAVLARIKTGGGSMLRAGAAESAQSTVSELAQAAVESARKHATGDGASAPTAAEIVERAKTAAGIGFVNGTGFAGLKERLKNQEPKSEGSIKPKDKDEKNERDVEASKKPRMVLDDTPLVDEGAEIVGEVERDAQGKVSLEGTTDYVAKRAGPKQGAHFGLTLPKVNEPFPGFWDVTDNLRAMRQRLSELAGPLDDGMMPGLAGMPRGAYDVRVPMRPEGFGDSESQMAGEQYRNVSVPKFERRRPLTVLKTPEAVAEWQVLRKTASDIIAQRGDKIRQIAGDPDALIGFNGSLARGYKLGRERDGTPYFKGGYDVDGFIVSDKLASRFKNTDPKKKPWRDGREVEGLKELQDEIQMELVTELGKKGMKVDPDKPFTLKVCTRAEYKELIQNNEYPFVIK